MDSIYGGMAGGQIFGMRFVRQDPARDNGFLQAGANQLTLGISAQGTRTAPRSDDPGPVPLAIAGESIAVNGPGKICRLIAGSAVVRGDRLIPDSQGRGIPSATTGTVIQEVGARALTSCAAAGAEILVLVEQYPFRPALT
jgi:hypothetical protein